MKIYGLSTCVVCQRACKTLEAEGIEIEFRDVRSDPLSESELNELLNEFGDRLVDRTTNDYRSLNDWLKNSESEAHGSPGNPRPRKMVSRLGFHCGKGSARKMIYI